MNSNCKNFIMIMKTQDEYNKKMIKYCEALCCMLEITPTIGSINKLLMLKDKTIKKVYYNYIYKDKEYSYDDMLKM